MVAELISCNIQVYLYNKSTSLNRNLKTIQKAGRNTIVTREDKTFDYFFTPLVLSFIKTDISFFLSIRPMNSIYI